MLFPLLLVVFDLHVVWGKTVKELCQKKLYVSSGERNYIRHSAFSSVVTNEDIEFCKYEIVTEPGNLIRVHIKNHTQISARPREDGGCVENYIHIGNDPRRVGVEMLTSYKLCKSNMDQEIVSRGNYVWVIVRSLGPSIFPSLQIHYHSQPKVLCNATEFQCSPVQCVPKSAICNGVKDCDNDRDEYCDTGFRERLTDSSADGPCFMCGDGSCINPVLPRYSLDWGKQLWYLCDEYPHCPDGTDERKDVCYRIKGRASALFKCTPTHSNVTAHLWNTVVCDQIQHCVDGEDESPELCATTAARRRVFEPVSIILPFAAVAMVILGGLAGRAINRIQERHMSLPVSCMDTTYIFTELSNTPTTVEEEITRKQDYQLGQESGDINSDHRMELDFDDDLDVDDLDLDDFENYDPTFTVVTTEMKQTTV